MKAWAELLQAVAALLWPILAFVVLLVFRGQIQGLLNRLRRGKVLGQEIELDAIQAHSRENMLASSAVNSRLEEAVSTKEFQAKLDRGVATHPHADHAQIRGRVINYLKTPARQSVREVIIK